ncbi:MAG: hypothetical protein ACYCVN_14640 [Acidimicrobiales bacterium]
MLVFIHHDTRLVRIAGITSHPVAGWITHQARNISMELIDRAKLDRFLIRDRDSKFTTTFDAVFAADGTRVIATPARAPRANAMCECVIDTIRRDCLDRVLILGRRHLAAVLVRVRRALQRAPVPQPTTARRSRCDTSQRRRR